ncbi:MAG TPA: hypothetical protein GXZ82_07630 [Firmicutes bacterium]|nr:hypothetical protein [Bacillota bacterium]
MIRIAKDDVLRGLKAFKRLAKQDFLASPLTANPQFWSTQARARRREYDVLAQIVDKDGVEAAYDRALERYASLPHLALENESNPEILGQKQALDMFFMMLGKAPMLNEVTEVPVATGAH